MRQASNAVSDHGGAGFVNVAINNNQNDNSNDQDGQAADNNAERLRGLSVTGAALSFISSIIGAGIVSLPYALSQAGYTLGVALHLVMIVCLMIAVILCLKAKDNLGY